MNSGSSFWHSGQEGIEHANTAPQLLVLFNELQVSGVLLVLIMGFAAFEYNDQGDVELLVVHLSRHFFGSSSDSKVGRSFMVGQVFVAGGSQLFLIGLRAVSQSEEDDM